MHWQTTKYSAKMQDDIGVHFAYKLTPHCVNWLKQKTGKIGGTNVEQFSGRCLTLQTAKLLFTLSYDINGKIVCFTELVSLDDCTDVLEFVGKPKAKFYTPKEFLKVINL